MMLPFDNGVRLLIISLSRAVIAKNGHGEMSQFFQFSAQMLPKFASRLTDQEANEGNQASIQC